MKLITTLLVMTVGALTALSLTMLTSATMLDRVPEATLMSQAAACVVGVAGMLLAASLDHRRWMNGSWPLYGGTVLLLLLVFVFGHEAKGARRWLWGMQPAELAKLALIVVLSSHGARRMLRMQRFWDGIVLSMLMAFPLIGLVLLEPDRGTAALLVGMTVILLLLGGVRWWHVAVPAAAGVVAIGVMILVSPMAQKRLEAWRNPEQHRDDSGLQTHRGLLAFGGGGIEGRGLGRGTLKYNVPEVHTDFILPAVGEELGLTFTLSVVVAYLVILWCGATVALRSSDRFGQLLAAGITFLICAQAVVNIGVVTAVFPNKGMPLPFVSRGGSNLVVLLTLVGMLISVARAAAEEPYVPEEPGESKGHGRRNPFSTGTDFAEASR